MLSKDQMFWTNLSGLPDNKMKTQEPKTYIHPLFHVLSTTATTSEI